VCRKNVFLTEYCERVFNVQPSDLQFWKWHYISIWCVDDCQSWGVVQ
jgi:hypothetical protein